jgi:superfamily I DNA/RNA helicase
MAPLPTRIVAVAPAKHQPSPQQAAVYDWTSNGAGSAVIEAVAGAGKTTTLINLLDRTTGTVAFMAYNKKIAEEIEAKAAPLNLGNRVRIGTVHSFGFAALRASCPRTKVDGKKLITIAKRLIENKRLPIELHEFAVKAAAMAKQSGIGAMTDIASPTAWAEMIEHHAIDELLPEEFNISVGIRAACALLIASNDMADQMIDFDDMIYLPLQRGLAIKPYDWVLLDEAQDTNATRRALARKMLAPGGRMVAVGDPAQAIYGFTGADSDSLDLIRADFNAITLPLTVSYRCPKAVVAEARKWVQHIQPADNAIEGSVERIDEDTFWAETYATLNAEDAILCRNTAPLVAAAYRLIRNGMGCYIEGRDIGTGLIKLATKWKTARTVADLRDRLSKWSKAEIKRALDKSQDAQAARIDDQTSTLFEIMSALPDDAPIASIQTAINTLFGDTPAGQRPRVVTLSTIHKSKGREWKRVLWWGANAYQPSPFARQAWQQGQERNLMYVAATRAQETLVHVTVEKEAEWGVIPYRQKTLSCKNSDGLLAHQERKSQ